MIKKKTSTAEEDKKLSQSPPRPAAPQRRR